ncbi:MAG: DEAD/DEAH box helicase [Myxococcota bacterium]
MAIDDLLKAIRESCSPGTWSRGVQLARAGQVVGEDDDGDEIALRVATKGGLVSLQVVLFPDDEDWTCECNSREDACAHVAAAAIALKQAWSEGKRMPGEGETKAAGPVGGHLEYVLQNHDGKLALFRLIIAGEKRHQLNGSIAQVAMGKVKGPKFVATDGDLKFEKKLGSFGGGIIPKPLMAKVLGALQGLQHVTLDGKPITVGGGVSGLAVRVSKNRDGYLAKLEQDPTLDRLFDNGAALRGDKLGALGDHGLTPGEYDTFRRGKVFHPTDLGTLVGDWMPKLRRKMHVIAEFDLPTTTTMKPRLSIASTREGDDLVLLPTILYGEPAVARVDGDKLTLLRDGEVPLRNPRLENLLREQLAGRGLEVGVKRSLHPAEAIDFTARMRDDEDVALQGKAHEAYFDAGELDAHLDVGDDGGVDLWFGDAKQSRADAAAVVRAWEAGDPFAPLAGGGFGRVPTGWLAQHGHRLVALLAARDASQAGKELPAWSGPDVAALCEALEQPAPPSFSGLAPLLEDFDGLPDPALPEDLTATLRDYQREGVAWLSFLRSAKLGALLADDMGLGKTLQTLCSIRGRTLVVAPTSVLPNWASEAAKFRPSLRCATYHGPGRALDPKADITLTTYALLRLDLEKLSTVEWETVVLDEAQAIKNPDSKVARAAFELPADFRIALTGTPVENRLDDLWSQFHFINRGLLGGRTDFGERYVKPIEGGDAQTAAALRNRVKPFLLRRLKKEVATELPPRTDVALHCELEAEERQTYDAIRAATQDTIMKQLGEGGNVMAMLEALLRLRQAACHRALIPGHGTDGQAPSSKVALLLETLGTAVADGHKALVFSQWTSFLDLLEPHLKAAGHRFNRLDGSTKDRGAVVDAFQAEGGPDVMLLSLKAGGTGLNLTAADHVFLMDPWWNPAVEDQAADRAHRIGQENPVLVHRLVAKDTVEERILALQDKKRALAEAAVGDGGGGASITRDELLELLS